MLQPTLNLGILAHVDAGKTTLTEQLLYSAGVIDEVGSVDAGTTQTDSLALERERGITIRAAVVSFSVDDVTVNLIDTPGHPDFIAEVERVLDVLDGAVLVISAVEGVQPQTRILMRALKRLGTPTLLFVNKIDRAGADDERVLESIRTQLGLTIVPMSRAVGLGTPDASAVARGPADEAFVETLTDVLARHDDALLAAYVEGGEERVSYERLRASLAAQTKRAQVHPVFVGSAKTGAGVEHIRQGIAELLPAAVGDADAPLAATVFKIERGNRGEKVAYVRVFSGTIRARERLSFGRDGHGKATSIGVFEDGEVVDGTSASAGQIAKVWGLDDVQIGDRLGESRRGGARPQFAPPTLETIVVARQREQQGRLVTALRQLAEQDPLINVRADGAHNIAVSLYGEVQKEVIQATLASEFDIEVDFRETTTVYIERPTGRGHAVELLVDDENPFSATVGLLVEPGPAASGLVFKAGVDPRRLPLYIYKNVDDFSVSMTQYLSRAFAEGLYGWQVTDCVVTLDDCDYYIGDGPKKPTAPTPRTTAADFRKLTPMVAMAALERAGTVVCEPILKAHLEVPSDTLSSLLASVARLGGVVDTPSLSGRLSVIETELPSAVVQDLTRQLPGLTGGEGVIETHFHGYRPVTGPPPTRPRTVANPLNRVEYLMEIRGRAFRDATQ